MKLAAKGIIAFALAFGAIAIAQESNPKDREMISVLKPPAPVEQPVLQEPAPTVPDQSTPAEVTLAPARVVLAPSVAEACCQPCCTPRCVPTTLCLVDPCGCSHEACVEVPSCCVGQQPEICWRNGALGRQVATLCWSCCDYETKVIVTRNGKVRVRG